MRKTDRRIRVSAYGWYTMKLSFHKSPLLLEVLVRCALFGVFVALEHSSPYYRVIQKEELWQYRYPHVPETIPIGICVVLCVVLPSAFYLIHTIITGNVYDLRQSLLGSSLAVLLTIVVIDVIKLCVGRPRPDFFYRCFPSGEMASHMECTGDEETVMEGRKSFPSGHSGFFLTSFGFLSLYLSGKLMCFRPEGRGQAWRLCVALSPLLVAVAAAASRVRDYRHHWQDVLVGGAIGFALAVVCYRQFYPSPRSHNCSNPLNQIHEPATPCTRTPKSPVSPDTEFV